MYSMFPGEDESISNESSTSDTSQQYKMDRRIQEIRGNLSINSLPQHQFKQIISLYRYKNTHPAILSNENIQRSLLELLQYYNTNMKKSDSQRNCEKIRLGTIRLISWIGTHQDSSIFKLIIIHPMFLSCFLESLRVDIASGSEEQLKTLSEMLDFIKFGCDHSVSFSEMLPYTDILVIIHDSLHPMAKSMFFPSLSEFKTEVKRKRKRKDVREKVFAKLLYLYHQVLSTSSSFPSDVSKIELHFQFFNTCMHYINQTIDDSRKFFHQFLHIVIDIVLLYVKHEKIRFKALDFFGRPEHIKIYLLLFPKIVGQEKRLMKLVDTCMTHHISSTIENEPKSVYKSLCASVELVKPLLDHIISLLERWLAIMSDGTFLPEATHNIKIFASQMTRVLSYVLIHGIESNLTEDFAKQLRIDRLFSSSFVPLLAHNTFTFSMLNILFLCCISSSQILYWLIQCKSLDMAFYAFSITGSTKCVDMALNIINTMTPHSDFMYNLLSHKMFFPKLVYLFTESILHLHPDYLPSNRSLWITDRDFDLYFEEDQSSSVHTLLMDRFYITPFHSTSKNHAFDSDSEDENENRSASATLIYTLILSCFKNWSGRRQFSHSLVLDTFHGKLLAYFGSLWYRDTNNSSTIKVCIQRILLYLPIKSDLHHTDVYNLLYFLVHPLLAEFINISGISGSQELFYDEKNKLNGLCDFDLWKKRLEENDVEDIRLIFIGERNGEVSLDPASSFTKLAREWKKVKVHKNGDEIQNEIMESACADALSLLCLLGIHIDVWREQVLPPEFDQRNERQSRHGTNNDSIESYEHFPDTILIIFPDGSNIELPGELICKQSIFFRHYVDDVIWKHDINKTISFVVNIQDMNGMTNIPSLKGLRAIFETISKGLSYDPDSHVFLKHLETSHSCSTTLQALTYYLQLFFIFNKYLFVRWEDRILYLVWRIFLNLDLKKIFESDLRMILDAAFGDDSVIFRIVRPYLPRWMKKIGWLVCCRFPKYALEHFNNEALFLCFKKEMK